MLKRFNMEDCNGCATPCTTKLPEISNESEPDKRIPYEALVGSLLWISLGTRGDICYSVHQLSKYVKCYNNEMWTFGKRVLRYLKQTMNKSLTFSSNPNSTNSELIGYSDSSFADDKSDRRSTYGYCIYYNQNCISWSSKKMDSVALSTCETEFVSVVKLAQEAIYLQQLINELFPNSIQHFKIYCDNKSAISLANNSTDHGRSKHIDIKYHFIRELIKKKTLQLEYIDSENQTADIFTKGLNREKLNRHRLQLKIEGDDVCLAGGVLSLQDKQLKQDSHFT